jgi:hypothetical protein
MIEIVLHYLFISLKIYTIVGGIIVLLLSTLDLSSDEPTFSLTDYVGIFLVWPVFIKHLKSKQ